MRAQAAEDIADLLAPQSGAYYDVWLDGEKFLSSVMEVRTRQQLPGYCNPTAPWQQQHSWAPAVLLCRCMLTLAFWAGIGGGAGDAEP